MTNVYRETTDSIWSSKADAIVIATNALGIQGAGMAKAWRDLDAEASAQYTMLCRHQQVLAGQAVTVPSTGSPPYVWIAAVTKQHFRNLSSIDTVRECIANVARIFNSSSVMDTLAIPLLGGGLGGVPPEDIIAELRATFDDGSTQGRLVTIHARPGEIRYPHTPLLGLR
jgi:O-acetyl-ADP-ribose deacetylase (regulator of RNase III)